MNHKNLKLNYISSSSQLISDDSSSISFKSEESLDVFWLSKLIFFAINVDCLFLALFLGFRFFLRKLYLRFTFKDHDNSVLTICYLRDGRIASGDSTGKMIIWSKNFSFVKEIKEHEDAVNHIIQLKDGRIVSSSADKKIIIWDLDFKILSVFNEHSESINKLCALREGGFVSAGTDKIINFWK